MANTKTSLQSKKEKKNRPTTSKNRTSSEERWTPKEYIIAKVLPVTSVDCGSSTGEPAASRSPRISAARRRFFLRWLFNHLKARLNPALLLPLLPLPPCRSSLNTCSISGGIRSPTDSRPDDIVQPAIKTEIIHMSHCFVKPVFVRFVNYLDTRPSPKRNLSLAFMQESSLSSYTHLHKMNYFIQNHETDKCCISLGKAEVTEKKKKEMANPPLNNSPFFQSGNAGNSTLDLSNARAQWVSCITKLIFNCFNAKSCPFRFIEPPSKNKYLSL